MTDERHKYEHIIYGEPQCSCGWEPPCDSPLARMEEAIAHHIAKAEIARLSALNERLRDALEEIRTTLDPDGRKAVEYRREERGQYGRISALAEDAIAAARQEQEDSR